MLVWFLGWVGRSPGGGHGNPLQYSCLENPMGRGAWRATVHGVTKSQTRLKWLSTHVHTPEKGKHRQWSWILLFWGFPSHVWGDHMPLQDVGKAEGTRAMEALQEKASSLCWHFLPGHFLWKQWGAWGQDHGQQSSPGATRILPFLNHRGRGPRSSYQCKAIVIRPRRRTRAEQGPQEGLDEERLGSGRFLKTPGEGTGVGLLGGQGGSGCFLISCIWWFRIVLEKTLESPLNFEEIRPVSSKGNQPWMFTGRTDAEADILATWCGEPTHWKRPWCWERLKAGGEGDDRAWGGWMASVTQWAWVWASSGRQQRTGKSGVLQSMESQRVRQDLAAEQQEPSYLII